MNELLFLILGAVVGAALAALFAQSRSAALRERLRGREEDLARLQREYDALRAGLDEARAAHARAGAELAAERAASAEKVAALQDAHTRAANEFKALSAAALQANNTAFLDLARETLSRTRQLADVDLEKRQLAIDALVQPLRTTLAQVETRLGALDEARAASAAALGQQLQTLVQAQSALQNETARLSTALRSTTTAGTWGELQLRRVVELAGLSPHCDFTAQASVTTEDRARLRPDLVVRLPGGQHLVVDAKAPNEAYREAASAADEATRAARLAEHAAKVSGHVNTLAAKAYWEQFQPAPEFVVLFLPGDQFLAAALTADPELLERALAKKVLLATPVTLIALLKSAAYGWRQETAARNAEAIAAQARELHDRVAGFAEHLGRIGPALDTAARAHNAAIGAFESRVLPAGRRLVELGAKGHKDLPDALPDTAEPLRVVTPPPPAA
ncbi:MAG: DNA recombination protein RmuC [Opitutaceae bacterium]|jgi:DNA recombination protein RmuC|nr:DNA recombination protein RmuC [Opitutaceae bacterium]